VAAWVAELSLIAAPISSPPPRITTAPHPPRPQRLTTQRRLQTPPLRARNFRLISREISSRLAMDSITTATPASSTRPFNASSTPRLYSMPPSRIRQLVRALLLRRFQTFESHF